MDFRTILPHINLYIQATRYVKKEPIWINPLDAVKRGIESGDVVKVYNDRGAVLGGAYVTERVMSGVVYIDQRS